MAELEAPTEALEAAARALEDVRRFVALGMERGDGARPKLAFSEAEELALEEKVGGAIRAYEREVERAREWAREGQARGGEALAEAADGHEQQLRRCTVECRKLLVMYRQRAKAERMERARGSLIDGAPSSKKGPSNNASSASAGDVTAALKRTKDVMAQEIERVASVARVLDDGRLSLQSSHAEYSGVNAEIASVRKRLKALQWQAQQDRMWIGAGIAVLAATVLFIIYERTGLLFI